MWIGDFVRCHTVVKLLKARFPARPVDMLSHHAVRAAGRLHAGGAQGDRGRPAAQAAARWRNISALAARLRREAYGTALVMPRTWKAALAPVLAGIPERIGWVGEWRFGLINDLRFGERKRPRMVDQCAALALPADAAQPDEWPLPELRVPPAESQAGASGWA